MSSKKLPLITLRKTRLKNNLRQKDIAYVLGCTTQYYSQLERGINVLSYDYATRLALMFNTTPDELFFEEYKKVYILM
ncbi:MAG: helix-turn-helix transcriptional regulator [Thomasclavelia ramosa]